MRGDDRSDGVIFVQPIAGLANRMRVLDSAIALATETSQDLSVLWTSNRDLNCRFERLFVQPGRVRRLHQLNTIRLSGKVLYRLIRFLFQYFCPFQLTDSTLEPLFNDDVDLAGLVRGRRVAIFGCKRFYEAAPRFGSLAPVPSLQAVIDSVSATLGNAVGVHIRRGDHEWTVRYSPSTEFIRLMEAELLADAGTTFFVATDSPEEEERLREAFPGRIRTHRKRSYDRADPRGIEDALVDLFCLSKCRKLIGSFASSYSEVAWQIRGIPVQRARVMPSLATEFSDLTDASAVADDARCFETIRRVRWARGVFCQECGGDEVAHRGADAVVPQLQTYRCRNCVRLFNDLTGTVLAPHASGIGPWLRCLCYANQNLSTSAIARHLNLSADEVAAMLSRLRQRP